MSKSKKQILKPQECPSCGYKLEIHTSLENPDDKPSPNDLSVCYNCGTWNKYGKNLEILSLTDEEKNNIDNKTLNILTKISEKIKKNNNFNKI